MNETEQILEHLRPRMEAARLSHVRKVLATLAVVPLLGLTGVAVAAGGDDGSAEIETATSPVDDEIVEPDVSLPEIGAAEDSDPADEAPEPVDDEIVEPITTTTTTTTTAAPDPDAPKRIELGGLGSVDVTPTDGGFEVLAYGFSAGWEVLSSENLDGVLTIVVGDGEHMKVIAIEAGVRDEVTVTVEEVVIPTTTTTVKPEPDPEPVVTESLVVEVPGKGSFSVNRDGDTLTIGSIDAVDGYEAVVEQSSGDRVYVGFYGSDHVWYGKALINDAGQVEQYLWDEALGPEPIYQWVEIAGIGQAKFEAIDGEIRVFTIENADGAYGADHSADTQVAKVIFETEGPAYFIHAWVDENGAIVWDQGEIT